MTTLITGAGLVGTSFAQHAVRRGENVVFFDPQPRDEFLKIKLGKAKYKIVRKDVRDLPALIQAIKDHKITTVVHTAGLIGKRVDESLYTSFAITVGGTANVAEAVRLSGVKRLVHISTFGVYDRRLEKSGKIDESFPRNGGGAYGNFKVAKEMVLDAYSRLHGFELFMIRPANVYGLGHFWAGSGGGEKMQILVEGGLRGQLAKVPSSQTMDNEYVYAKDLGDLIDRAARIKEMPKKTIFNCGSGRMVPYSEMLRITRKVIPGLKVTTVKDGAPKKRGLAMSISAAKKHLGWTPKHSLEAGIRDYVKDIQAVGLDKLGAVKR